MAGANDVRAGGAEKLLALERDHAVADVVAEVADDGMERSRVGDRYGMEREENGVVWA